MLVIGCLSQKGGVGKSTLARLIAGTYATGGWRVKIADFNVKQKTSVDWAALRMDQGVKPTISAEAFVDVNRAIRQPALDLMVIDGKPDSDMQTLQLAQKSNLIVIPTGVSSDDLLPQVRFAQELRARGVSLHKILFVLNKTTDSKAATDDAFRFIRSASFKATGVFLPSKTAYVNAHNSGRTLAETEFPSLNKRATALVQEIIDTLDEIGG